MYNCIVPCVLIRQFLNLLFCSELRYSSLCDVKGTLTPKGYANTVQMLNLTSKTDVKLVLNLI